MAIQWGSWAGSSTYRRERVGVDISISGITVTVKYHYETDGEVNDGQTLTRSGKITGSTNFTARQTATNGGSGLIATNTFTGARGASYSIGAKITGVWTGAVPTVSVSVTVPAIVPSTPGMPSVSSLTNSGWSASVGVPAANGSAINLYEWQWATNAGFTAGVGSTTSTGTSRGFAGFAANTTYWLRVRARNGAGYSGWSSARSFKTNPSAPPVPTGAVVTRVSDTSHTVKWNRTATNAGPWDNVILRRWDNVTNAWATLPTLAGTATSYTDNSTRADRRYQYQVQSRNTAGTSAAASTAQIVTTPAAPTGASARKSGQNIVVTFTANVSYGATHEVWHKAGTGAFTLLTTLAQGVSTYTHQVPSNLVTHQYQVRAKSAGPVLYSGYSTTEVVQLAAPPNAPTITGPLGAFDPNGPMTFFSWRHNPVDSSDQTYYQTRHRRQGTTAWTESGKKSGNDSSIPYWQFDPDYVYVAGDTIEWQVRTWGVHVDASPWSATAAVQLSSRPTATISDLNGVYDHPTLTVAWSYYQAESVPQGQWLADLINQAGTTVQTVTGSGTATEATFSTVMPDDTEWSVRVAVRSGAGLWSEPEPQTFRVAYPEPVPPVVSANYDPETGTMEVGVENPPPGVGTFELMNLATHPSFETTSGTVEVARNYFPNPAGRGVPDQPPSGFSSWAGAGNTNAMRPGSGEGFLLGGSCLVAWHTVTTPSSGDVGIIISAGVATLNEGDIFTVAFNRRASRTGMRSSALNSYAATGTILELVARNRTPILVMNAGEIYHEWITFKILPHTQVPSDLRINSNIGPISAGDYFETGDVDFYVGPYQPGRKPFNGGISPDPDLTPSWLGPVNNSASTLTATRAAGTGVGWQSQQWAATGVYSHYIPDGSVQEYVIGDGESFQIQPRTNGQTYLLNGDPHVTTEDPIQVSGPAIIEVGAGWWDSWMHTDYPHQGDYWDGNTPGHVTPDGYLVTYRFEGDPDASVSVATYSPAPETAHNTVYRSVDGGPWVLVADDVPVNGVIVDPLPTLAGSNRYKVTAWTDLPSTTDSDPFEVITAEPGWVFVNYGPGFAEFARVYGNVQLSGDTERPRTLHRFAGRRRPVAFFGEGGTQTVKVSGRLTPDASTLTEWEDTILTAEMVCLRDPKGRRIFGALGPLTHTWQTPTLVSIGFEVEEVDHDEQRD